MPEFCGGGGSPPTCTPPPWSCCSCTATSQACRGYIDPRSPSWVWPRQIAEDDHPRRPRDMPVHFGLYIPELCLQCWTIVLTSVNKEMVRASKINTQQESTRLINNLPYGTDTMYQIWPMKFHPQHSYKAAYVCTPVDGYWFCYWQTWRLGHDPNCSPRSLSKNTTRTP